MLLWVFVFNHFGHMPWPLFTTSDLHASQLSMQLSHSLSIGSSMPQYGWSYSDSWWFPVLSERASWLHWCRSTWSTLFWHWAGSYPRMLLKEFQILICVSCSTCLGPAHFDKTIKTSTTKWIYELEIIERRKWILRYYCCNIVGRHQHISEALYTILM